MLSPLVLSSVLAQNEKVPLMLVESKHITPYKWWMMTVRQENVKEPLLRADQALTWTGGGLWAITTAVPHRRWTRANQVWHQQEGFSSSITPHLYTWPAGVGLNRHSHRDLQQVQVMTRERQDTKEKNGYLSAVSSQQQQGQND